jgi:hypothetical protein
MKDLTHNERIKPKIIEITKWGTELQQIVAEAWIIAFWGDYPKQNAAQYMNRIEYALIKDGCLKDD